MLFRSETVSENQLEEAEISLSGYCGRESENDGKNVTYTISDSDNDGIYDLLEIKGNGRIRESGTPDTATADVKYGLDDLSNPLPWQIDINELELTKVVIGEGITDISSACYCLDQLKEVNISNGVTDIQRYAFYGCLSLEEIHIPESVQSIRGCAFERCSSLKKVTIPNSVTRIDWRAFCGCSSLEEIHIPDSVQSIELSAFEDCSALKVVNIPNSVTGISEHVFRGCSSLEEIHIPDSVQSIGWNAFEDCSALKVVNIPNSVTGISERVFSGCSSLEEIYIPDSVQSIGVCAFHGCSSLEEIYIPDSVQSISQFAFEECNSLKIAFLPSSCKNGSQVKFPDTTSTIRYTIDNTENAHISSIRRGKGAALVEIPDTLYNYSILSVDEMWRILVSETGHTHKYNEAGICQICNKCKEQDSGAAPDTDIPKDPDKDIPKGPDTWKDKEGIDAFVYRLYNIALIRDGEKAGLEDWIDRLDTKKESAAEVAWGFFFSDEFLNKNYTDEQYIELLYLTMFGRESDGAGKKYWLECLENGVSREYIYRGFAESPEFTGLCGDFGVERGFVDLNQYRDQNIEATGFIARLYTQMLGRSFDDDGIEYWCQEYLGEDSSIEEIAADGFLHSTEFKNQNLSNREFVIRMYRTFLNREPDEEGRNFHFCKNPG